MRHIKTTINGERSEFLCEDGQTLLEALRDVLQMTGTKEGCGTGDCGACSVIFNGRLVCSCLVLAAEAEGGQVETVEGMEGITIGETAAHMTVNMGTRGINVSTDIDAESMRMIIAMSTTDP